MKLEVIFQGQVVLTKDLAEGQYKIGRAPECEIRIKSPQVSKTHGLIVIKNNKAAIVDSGSANGIFVNGILIKKKLLETTDRIEIAGHEIRLLPEKAKKGPSIPRAGGGNLAEKLDPQEEAPPVLTPQEKIVHAMDTKVLVPFYEILRTVDFRWLLGGLIGAVCVTSILFTVAPMYRWGTKVRKHEALTRAHAVLDQVVRENYRVLSKTNDVSRLTTEVADKAEGFLGVFVVDPRTDSIFAPAKYFNKTITDAYGLLAIRELKEGKETVEFDKGDDLFIVGQRIPYFSQDADDNVPVAVAIGEFELGGSMVSTLEALVTALLIAVLIGLLAYYFVYKMFSYPLIQLQEQMDASLRGEDVTVECFTNSSEMEALVTQINFALSRARQSGGGQAAMGAGVDEDMEKSLLLHAVQGAERISSDALVLLDKDKRVKFVGRALEELIGLRNQYAMGQNISDACRDQSFAGTAIDLADRVLQTLGEAQDAVLEINGVSRNMGAVALKTKSGEIQFILISVKLGGG